MIKQWIKAGNDWIALDDQNRACYVLKTLNDESIVPLLKESEIGFKRAREPCEKRSGIPDVVLHLARRGGVNHEMNQCMDVIERARKISTKDDGYAG